ncbi:MAG: hypothetical protein ABI324_05290 [Ktedonobacteraceae bacterium]
MEVNATLRSASSSRLVKQESRDIFAGLLLSYDDMDNCVLVSASERSE